jgi:hypothetical protein
MFTQNETSLLIENSAEKQRFHWRLPLFTRQNHEDIAKFPAAQRCRPAL